MYCYPVFQSANIYFTLYTLRANIQRNEQVWDKKQNREPSWSVLVLRGGFVRSFEPGEGEKDARQVGQGRLRLS